MIRYTLGFLFNKDFSKVLLIHKLSPEWQKGKVNGLGGKFEENETSNECISREVEEESSLITKASLWRKVGELHSSKFNVDVMTYVYEGRESGAISVEKQQVEWFPVARLPENIMSNLTWLIPICIDTLQNGEIKLFVTTHAF